MRKVRNEKAASRLLFYVPAKVCAVQAGQRQSAIARQNKGNERFRVFKGIVIAQDALTVIDDSLFFIGFQAIQQSLLTVSFDKQGKCKGLDFAEHTFLTGLLAYIAMGNALFQRTPADIGNYI